MKKIYLTFLVLFLIISLGLSAKEMKSDRKIGNRVVNIHQVGRAPLSNSSSNIENNFTLKPNSDELRYDYDVYTGNTTGFTYNAVDLTNGALTPTGAIIDNPFPMAEEYDGNTIYRIYSDLSIVEVNPDDGVTTALGTISGVAGTPTGLAYKWDTSTMYVVILDAGNAPHFCTLDLTTFVATEIGVGTGMVIAMDFASDGYLYTPSIDDDNFYQVDPATGISTLIGPIGYDLNFGQDVTYDYLTDQLFTISCGGAYVLGTYDLTTGALTQIVDMGGNQHATLVSTIASTDPNAPAAPSDVVVTPDAGGGLSCDISWTCPDLTFGGDPLTELLEMCVYRDGELVYTDSSPIIGGAGSYTDYPAEAGSYSYSVVGFNTIGEGGSASATVWIGEDVPNAVTDLTLTDVSAGTLVAQLDWVNPTTGYHGGYFTGVLGYDIVRSDDTPFVVTGSTTTWQDDSIVDPGVYSYTITPFNASGSGPSTTSAQVGIGVSIIQVGNEEIQDFEIPMNMYWHNTIVEVVYDKEWIGSDMLINTVGFHTAAIGSTINTFNLEIWLGEVDIDDLSGGFLTDSDLMIVYDGTIDVPPGDNWIELALDTPFEYTYNHNLVMGIIKDDDEYYSTSDIWWTSESGTADRALHAFSDSDEFFIQTPPATPNTKTTYPDVRFYYSPLEYGDVAGEITDVVTTDPIDGVEVYVGAFGPATTNASGEYLLEDVVLGTHEVTAFKDGYYDFVGSVEVLSGQVVTYDFAMDPNLFGTLDGTVTDADTGDPLVGAIINAISLAGYEYDAVTDDEGYFIIDDVVAETYDVSCSFPDYPTGIVEDVVIEDGITSTVDFSLEGYTYWNDFEVNDGGLISSDIWDWGTLTSGPMSGYSGTNGWATSIGGDYPNDSNCTLDTPTSYMIAAANAMLEFWHWYNIENSWDGGNVKISTDGGSSWNVIVPLAGYTGVANTANPLNGEEIFCGITPDWEIVQFDLSGYVGQSVMFRWHFGSDSSVQNPGWYIDDVAISGGGISADPGYIEGTVVIADGAGNVEDVIVEAGGETTNPAADGTYFFELQPGTYDVTATLTGYDTETIEDVVVTEGNSTTGVDFNLFTGSGEIIVVATKLDNNYPNPFNPETRINFSIKEVGNVTIEVYNIRGQLVKILVDDLRETGIYTVIWNGTDNSNKSVSSGVYFYKMKAQNYNSTKKMILMK